MDGNDWCASQMADKLRGENSILRREIINSRELKMHSDRELLVRLEMIEQQLKGIREAIDRRSGKLEKGLE